MADYKQGLKNIELAEGQMSALMELKRRFTREKPFKNLRIGMALHVTKETAVLVRTLVAGGAKVCITGCNPLSTQDDVAEALRKEGVLVYGHRGENAKEYYEFLKKVIAFKPQITIDDGCDLVSEIHKNHKGLLKYVIGGCEETTTGVIRLKAMEKAGAVRYPIIAVNDNKTKHLMDNYYGTGQSSLDGVMRASNFMFAGKTVVVAGYGSCGKGVGLRARGMGARVVVTEVAEVMALQAAMDGFEVMKMERAAALGDLFITVTGDMHVLTMAHIKKMKNGAILANSGHFDVEIDVKAMHKAAKKVETVRPNMEKFTFANGKFVYLLGEGRLVNLAAAEGHPSEVMSMSFCGQALSCEFLVKNKGKLKPQIYNLPGKLDNLIAAMQLKAMGISIDSLTPEQKKYLASWEVGT